MFIAVAAFKDSFSVGSYIKPYKMCYIGGFIMKYMIDPNYAIEIVENSIYKLNWYWVRAKSSLSQNFL